MRINPDATIIGGFSWRRSLPVLRIDRWQVRQDRDQVEVADGLWMVRGER